MSEDFLSLTVVKEPPEEWYNQQGGKHRTIDIVLRLEGEIPAEVVKKEGIIPLNVLLLYENRQPVKDQSILELKEAPELDVNTKLAKLKLRVTQVSSVHQKQRFRFKISVNHSNSTLASTRPTFTGPVRVLSKTTKNKRRKIESPSDSQQEANDPSSSPSTNLRTPGTDLPPGQVTSLLDWCAEAINLCNKISWQVIGYECVQHSVDGAPSIDANLPIYRCPLCQASGTVSAPGVHAITCPFNGLQKRYLAMMSEYVDGTDTGRRGEISLPPSSSSMAAMNALQFQARRLPSDMLFPSWRGFSSTGSAGSMGPFFPSAEAFPVGGSMGSGSALFGRTNSVLPLPRSDSMHSRKRTADEITGSGDDLGGSNGLLSSSSNLTENHLSLSQPDGEGPARRLPRDSSLGFISQMLQADNFEAGQQEYEWFRLIDADLPEEGRPPQPSPTDVGILWRWPLPTEKGLAGLVFKEGIPVVSPRIGLLGFIHSQSNARTGRVASPSVLLAVEDLGLSPSHGDLVGRLATALPELRQQLPISDDSSPLEEKAAESDLSASGLVFTPLSECWVDKQDQPTFPPSATCKDWTKLIVSRLNKEAAGIQRSLSISAAESSGALESSKQSGAEVAGLLTINVKTVLVLPIERIGDRAKAAFEKGSRGEGPGGGVWSKRDSADAVLALDRLRRGTA